MAAKDPKELWILPGMGHAEAACTAELVDRIGRWVDHATSPARAVTPVTVPPGEPAGAAPGEMAG
jgi:hypothetical protein